MKMLITFGNLFLGFVRLLLKRISSNLFNMEIYNHKYVTEKKSIKTFTLTVHYETISKKGKTPQSNWQNVQVWCGRIALAILFVVIYFALR